MSDEHISINDKDLIYPWQKKSSNNLSNQKNSKEAIISKLISYELKNNLESTQIEKKIEDEEDEYAVLIDENKERALNHEKELNEIRKKEVFNMFLESAENDFKNGREFNSFDITLLIDYIDEHADSLDERETQLISNVNMNELKERVGEKIHKLNELIDEIGIERPEENKIQDDEIKRLPRPTPNRF